MSFKKFKASQIINYSLLIINFALIPVSNTSANISYELNSLLNSVFGEEELMPDFSPVKVESVTLPTNPTSTDWIEFNQRITTEENNLQQFSAKMVDLQAEIYELANQQNGLQRELTLLDGELALAEKNLAQLTDQENKWKTELDIRNAELKRLKSEQKEVIGTYKIFLQTNYLRQNRLTSDETVDMAQWLLGSSTAAEIQEQNLIREQYARQQSAYLSELNRIGNDIGTKQRIADNLYSKIAPLRAEAEAQKNTLASLAESKAKKINQQNTALNQKKSQLQALEREQTATKAFLQNLKKSSEILAERMVERESVPGNQPSAISSQLENEAQKIPNQLIPSVQNIEQTNSQISPLNSPLTQTWQSPLRIPLKVTANFLDPAYEAEFGREHLGSDFLAPQGTPIYAPKSGTIVKAVLNGYDYGYVIIDHGDDTYTLYGHVSVLLADEGDYLIQGQKFALTGGAPGTIGAGPWSTGAHLHLEVFQSEEHVDPVEFLGLDTN